uniref:Immunoglobulin domain-containing protein n=1 Tax=Echeneis naucrates TaxID=173247 RepID=A0A665SZE6_ECHNA
MLFLDRMMLLGLIGLLSIVGSSKGQDWNIFIPRQINATLGSTVIVKCHFTYPVKYLENDVQVYWKTEGAKIDTTDKDKNPFVYHPNETYMLEEYRGRIVSTNLPKWKMTDEYKKRTQLLGDLKTRNCSMLLDAVRMTDVGPFYFRIEMPQYRSFSYTKKTVTLNVTSHPQSPSLSVRLTDKVTASCSVSHSCPSFPPKFTWSRSGVITHRSKRLNDWKWETVSALTFKPLPADFRMPLNCTVQYRGGNHLIFAFVQTAVSVYIMISELSLSLKKYRTHRCTLNSPQMAVCPVTLTLTLISVIFILNHLLSHIWHADQIAIISVRKTTDKTTEFQTLNVINIVPV